MPNSPSSSDKTEAPASQQSETAVSSATNSSSENQGMATPAAIKDGNSSKKSTAEEGSMDRDSAITQALKFLRDPRVVNAPTDQKVRFLHSKGIGEAEIHSLIYGLERNESTETNPSLSQPNTPQETRPIITYPEFLIHSAKPPPLITLRHLNNVAYGTAGAVAMIYGLSKFIITPMVETLTTARHELASHAHAQLEELNSRLSATVSAAPVTMSPNAVADAHDALSEDSDTESDPAQLYHRDYGTQTTPSLSDERLTLPGNHLISTDVREVSRTEPEGSLKSLQSQISELLEASAASSKADNNLTNHLADLTSYLQEMVFASQPGFMGVTSLNGSSPQRSQDEAVNAVKAEIRGIKGVLLNARNFPASPGPFGMNAIFT